MEDKESIYEKIPSEHGYNALTAGNSIQKFWHKYKFGNVIYIGRPGRFKYTNQDHSIEMGVMAARSIVDGKKYDIEQVGAETEYFEKGYAPLKEAK